MFDMKKFHLIPILFIALCGSCAIAQLTPSSTADDVLNTLQTSGQNLKSFSAKVTVRDFDTGSGGETTRFGKVWFQIKPDGNPVMHIALDYKVVGQKPNPDKVDYLLDDGWLTDRTDGTKTEARIQLVPKGQKVNLFQLGKSPFPMPIGQSPDEIKKQFDLTKVDPAKDDPANSIHIRLTPKPDSDMAKRFSSVDIWTDLTTKMPSRIETIDSKKGHDRTADLIKLELNPQINPADVSLPTLPPDWRSDITPLPQH
jgi:outer membrane lipoprotein-sorting protein